MKKWIFAGTLFFAAIALILLYFPGNNENYIQNNSLKNATESGVKFLITSMKDGDDYLSCESSSVSHPCPKDMHGQNLTNYFTLAAIITQTKLPDSMRDQVKDRLLKEKYGEKGQYFWGYKYQAPPDADDTAFALQILLLLGEKIQTGGLDQFYADDLHAYATFPSNNTPTISITPASKNNRAVHPDVNANVLYLFQELNQNSKIDYSSIIKLQSNDGYWHTYFYPGNYYSTYINMRVLCRANAEPQAIQKGLGFLAKSQNQDGSWGHPGNPYDTALALNTLISCHQAKSAITTKGITYLLNTQYQSGFWKGNQIVWEYIPIDNPYVKWFSYDINHVLTTALATQALIQYQDKLNK